MKRTAGGHAKEAKPPSSPSSSSQLPVAAYRDAIVASVRAHRTTIVVGETGSGKSTQLPQYLTAVLGANTTQCIVCTQPRRVAAVTIAQRVASEMGSTLGSTVGYTVRFDDRCTGTTRIKYVTDGVLLREIMGDRSLARYGVVIVDEAHERSLQTDILMGLLRDLQDARPSLKIVVMSATLQVDLFMGFFLEPNLVRIPGRQHPVTALFLKEPEEDFLHAALLAVLQIHAEQPPGGVLVFLPGQDDIESLQALLEEHLPNLQSGQVGRQQLYTASSSDGDGGVVKAVAKNFVVHSLFAAMSPDDQLRAFGRPPAGVRKIVLSTNIAETSVTIGGLRYVVDSGFVKTRLVQPATGMDMLKVLPVSRSQAEQRAGRAGREGPGACYRLYPEQAFCLLAETTPPEIERVNIAQVVLQLKILGADPSTFRFLSPPPAEALRGALLLLLSLGALDTEQEITEHGRRMARLPLDPQYAHLLLKSPGFKCTAEVLSAVALLSTDNLFIVPAGDEERRQAAAAHRRFASQDGDLPTFVSIFDAWEHARCDGGWARRNFLSGRALTHALNVRRQLEELLRSMDIDPSSSCRPAREPFLRCLTVGLALNVARKSKDPGGAAQALKRSSVDAAAPYRTLRGSQQVHVHPSSVLFPLVARRALPECVVYAEILLTSKQYMRTVTAIKAEWLTELLPGVYKRRQASGAGSCE